MKPVEELLKLPTFGLAELYMFQYYQTREEAARALSAADIPPFNPDLPIKHWCDPRELDSWSVTASYARAVSLTSKGMPVAEIPASRTPKVAPLVIPAALARRLNIPSGGPAPEPVGYIPCPFNPLPEGCVLEIVGGSVAVVNKKHPHWQQGAVEERLANIQAMVHVSLKNIARLLEHFGLKEV